MLAQGERAPHTPAVKPDGAARRRFRSRAGLVRRGRRTGVVTAADPPGLAENLRSEQVAEVIRRIPVSVAVNAVNTLPVAWMLCRESASWAGPAVWATVMALILAARLVGWRLAVAGRLTPALRVWLTVLGALATGLAWGVGAALMLPASVGGQLVVAFVIGGMCAGSVTTSATYLPSLAAFVLSASLPLAARLLSEGTHEALVMGWTGLVFAGALLFTGRGFSASLKRRLALEWELSQANRKLREEIAQHRATEAALRQAQKLEAIGQLTAGIAHDFNNLLMVVAGHIGLLRSVPLPAELERRVAAIGDATARGSQLTRQLLAFGRRQRLEPRAVDLNLLLGEMARLLSRTLGRRIDVVFTPTRGLWPVFVDAGQIEHAILNLAINARDAMPDGGVVTIEATNAEGVPPELADRVVPAAYVRILVRDTGTGMPEEVLARAVEPFFTTKAPGLGSGLGLSQVYGLVHQSGGTLSIRSRLGEGTSVEIYLPRAHPTGDADGPNPYSVSVPEARSEAGPAGATGPGTASGPGTTSGQ